MPTGTRLSRSSSAPIGVAIQCDTVSNPSLRHVATAALVRRDHLERHERRTARLRVVRAGGDQRLRDALPPRAGADVHELDVRDTALGRLDAPDADRALVVLGDEDAAAADVVERVRPLLLPRLGLADRLGHLALELLPELAQDRLVGLGRAADRHGTSEPIRRYCADRFSNGWSCAAELVHARHRRD